MLRTTSVVAGRPRDASERGITEQVARDIGALISSYRRAGAAENLRPLALKTRDGDLRLWLRWMVADERLHSPSGLAQITQQDIAAFLIAERERGLQPSTLGKKFAQLHAFFNWLVREGDIAVSPMATMRPPRVPEKLTELLSGEEVRALLATCHSRSFDDRRDDALIRTLLDTGLRAFELLAIRREDVHLDEQIIVIPDGKGGAGRLVPVGQRTLAALDRYIRVRSPGKHRYATSAMLWIGQRGPLKYSGLRRMILRRGEQAGLHMWAHRLRHQFAHLALASGMQERDVMRIAGWKTGAMLARYGAAAATIRAIEAHKKHSPGDQF